MRLLVGLVVALWAGNVVAGDTAKHWNRFRGPNAAGVSDDKRIPLAFKPSENLVWKAELPGVGNSSPIVWGEHLFVHTTSKDGKQRSLVCLDSKTGKVRWQQTIAAAFVKVRPDSSLASATPTTDGKTVYVPFWNGKNVVLFAYDFDGKEVWHKDLGEFNSQHGPGASPILYKNKLILAHDMDKEDFVSKAPNPRPSFLMAFDKGTGQLLWETPRKAEFTSYSAPFLRQRPGQEPELVVTSGTAVTGYNTQNGEKLWEHKDWQLHAIKNPMRTVATPAMNGDILCVCSGSATGRMAIGLALPGSSGGMLQQLWENRKDFPYVPCPLTRGEHFYFVNDIGVAGCYEAKTGKRVWFERLGEGGFHSSPLLIDGKVYAISIPGDLYVFAAEPKFQLVGRSELGEPVRATPAVANDRLYVRGERHLFCIGTK